MEKVYKNKRFFKKLDNKHCQTVIPERRGTNEVFTAQEHFRGHSMGKGHQRKPDSLAKSRR